MYCSMPGFPVYHQLLELAQTHVHRVGDAIQSFHPLLFPTPPAFSLSRIRVFSNKAVLCIRCSSSVLPMNIQNWFPFGLTDFISYSPRDSQESSATPQFKGINSLAFSFLYIPNCHIHTWLLEKPLTLTRWNFVSKVTSMLFNVLFRMVIAFFSKEQASFHSMAAVTFCSDFGTPKNNVCHCFHCSPIYLPWSDRTRCHALSFWMFYTILIRIQIWTN